MGVPHDESWQSASNPRHLLRLTRVRPNGRKYLLLACAIVRHLVPGPRGELGLRVLGALERFALAQPARGCATHLWREVVRAEVPEVPDPLPPGLPALGADGDWVQRFAYRLGGLNQVHTSEVNELLDLAFQHTGTDAEEDGEREAEALAAGLRFGARPAPAGWFARQLRQVAARDPRDQLEGAKFREAVLGLLPVGRREVAEAAWPPASPGFSPWRRGMDVLAAHRHADRLAAAAAHACDLIREVFGNPFRPPELAAALLDWNHAAPRAIAARVADTGDFADLPILADALEDAGCTDAELLAHCREPRPHVPGCWALDAVLGR